MKKASYVDGYLLVVKKENLEAYKKMVEEAAQMWIKHGALSVKECMGDDLSPDIGGVEYPHNPLTKSVVTIPSKMGLLA